MITLHCSCGETIRTGLGPASVTCKCGKVHGLPSPAPSSPAAAAPVPPPAPEPAAPRRDSREGPLAPGHRVAIHDGLKAPRPEGTLSVLQNPAFAGGITVAILAATLVTVLVLRGCAQKKREEAASLEHGTECSFVNAGASFTAPPRWKITRNEGMTFAFDTGRGEISVSVLQVTPETHAERAKAFQPTGAWSAGASELPGADLLAATWETDRAREAYSWWLDRSNHRLWIGAEGKRGIREDAAALIRTLKLTDAAPPEDPTRK